jgi:hypothetical protein
MKKTLRLQGLVRLAGSVRRDLSSPISSERLEALREQVTSSLKVLDQLLADENVTDAALPIPSRRALQFLRSIDFSTIKPSADAALTEIHRPHITFPGINRYLQYLLDQLTHLDGEENRRQTFLSICNASRRMEDEIRIKDLQPSQFTPETLEIRAWLAFFSSQDNFNEYMMAVERACSAFEAVLPTRRFRAPAFISFQPIKGLYRASGKGNGTAISLPTPMISFNAEQFRLLAEVMFENKPCKKIIIQATLAESYLEIRHQLDDLAGMVEKPAGVFHDLEYSFSRVNTAYFQNSIVRPRLGWTKTFTNRRFGSYDFSRDILTVSATLDQSHVPEYVVDFIVYHELLHKKLGIRWQNDRKGVHTPEFQNEEKKFAKYAEANEVLTKIVNI